MAELRLSPSGCRDRVYSYCESTQQDGGSHLTGAGDTVRSIRALVQDQHRNSVVRGIDDPLLSDSCLRLLAPLGDSIALWRFSRSIRIEGQILMLGPMLLFGEQIGDLPGWLATLRGVRRRGQ